MKNYALKFIILMGFVSLFADMTYEGARGISGQYLALLGANGLIVGITAGFGELIGYTFRLVSGALTDKFRLYWPMTFLGYAINLLAVPMIALTTTWETAAFFIILERFGRAIRSPSKDAMLSYASKDIGRGLGFGINEAMDQTGAVLGPLAMSAILFYNGSYHLAFASLLIPALLALAILTIARFQFAKPEHLEMDVSNLEHKHFSRRFWIYMAALACLAAGFVDFPLISFYLKKTNVFSDHAIPILFSFAMASAGISSLLFGKLYDRYGITILIISTLISALATPCLFLGYPIIGMLFWGIGLGATESLLKAYASDIVTKTKRATAFGFLNFIFGISWFLGSALIGWLYDVSLPLLILFSVVSQLAAIPILLRLKYGKTT